VADAAPVPLNASDDVQSSRYSYVSPDMRIGVGVLTFGYE
jgi:hypothetical protein